MICFLLKNCIIWILFFQRPSGYWDPAHHMYIHIQLISNKASIMNVQWSIIIKFSHVENVVALNCEIQSTTLCMSQIKI